MNKERRAVLRMGAAVAALGVGAGAVPGAATAAEGQIELSPIVVETKVETPTGPVDGFVARRAATATKTDTPILTTPQSVSVITADRMQVQDVQTVPEALRYTAGVNTQPWGDDPRFDQFRVRGFEATTGGVYLDGLAMRHIGQSGWQFEPYGAERLEVMKGPASVLYGQVPPGGLVNLVSKRPVFEPFGEVIGKLGTNDLRQGAFDVGGALGGGEDPAVAARLTGLARASDDEAEHTHDDRLYLAPSVTWQPDEDTSVTLLASVLQDEGSGNNLIPARGSLYASPLGTIDRDFFVGDPNFDRVDQTQYLLGYDASHRLNDVWTIGQTARYGHLSTEQEVLFSAGLRGDGRTLDRAAFTVDDALSNIAVDTRATAAFATGAAVDHTLLLGVDVRHSSNDKEWGYGAAPAIDLFAPVYNVAVTRPAVYSREEQSLRQTGLYVQDQIVVDDAWHLSLGARHDWAKSDVDNLIAGTSTAQEDSAFTYRVGLGYAFDNGVFPYAHYATSFEPEIGSDAAGNPFDPTEGREIEVGVKVEPPGTNSRVTLALFDLKRQNVVYSDPLTFVRRQVGEEHVRGVELEGVAELAAGLSLTAAYTYTDSEFSKHADPTRIGNEMVMTPKHMASAWLDYTVQEGSLAGLGLGGGVRYVGESWGDEDNSIRNPDYTLVDAALRYQWDAVGLALNASNLLDNEYVQCNSGAEACYYGFGRSVTLTASVTW